ncbi:hypothetical protein EXIGLDRAFT_758942 [Exidia glandulosa HHB12029]|uniref:Hydrophobin n=1 Tax=Exidia glandulosa HHB12029 TaxID=1314781 RepID=A0A165QGU9_EXIGL|nr:hypothetical protein EXIGLDRAFT_758942 [Exidia glandulosa HHB12029]
MHFFTALTSLVLAAIVAASPAPNGIGGTTSTCNGGEAFCCNSFSQPVDPSTGDLASVPVDVLASLGCTPVSVAAILVPGTCSQSSVCCQDVGSNGLVNLQCIGLQV